METADSPGGRLASRDVSPSTLPAGLSHRSLIRTSSSLRRAILHRERNRGVPADEFSPRRRFHKRNLRQRTNRTQQNSYRERQPHSESSMSCRFGELLTCYGESTTFVKRWLAGQVSGVGMNGTADRRCASNSADPGLSVNSQVLNRSSEEWFSACSGICSTEKRHSARSSSRVLLCYGLDRCVRKVVWHCFAAERISANSGRARKFASNGSESIAGYEQYPRAIDSLSSGPAASGCPQ